MASNAQFSGQLEGFVKLSEKIGQDEVRKIALTGLSLVTKRSPVDKGTFKGNWNVALENPNLDINEDRRVSQAIQEGEAEIRKFKKGELLWISNNMPYADKLEYGHSQQAPSGVLRVTFQLLKAWVVNRRKFV